MSNVIDERVVQMEFDNAQFEQNVQTTLKSLETLQKSLQLDGASDGLQQVDSAAKSVDLSSLSESVESLSDRFSTMGIVGMTAISNITTKVMELISKLGSNILNGGITRAMNLENARFQIQGLLGDEEQVEAVMQNVNDAVSGTAYSLDAAAKVASQLVASGMSAGDELYTDLKAIAGVAAMTNSEYSEIGDIFATVAGQGKLMTQQLNQFANRGLNAAATLADYLGTTESAVREMVTAGEIDFQTFAAAMDDAFGEHAKKANETFSGALANIKSACSRIGAQFISPLIEQNGVMVDLFNTFREKLNDVNDNIGNIAEFVTGVISKIIKAVTKLLSVMDFTKPFKKLNDALGNPFSKMIEKVQSFANVTEEVSDAVETVSDTLEDFSDIVNQVIRGDFGNGQDRVEALTDAGYEWAHIQNLVNEQLGDSTRHASEYEDSLDDTTSSAQAVTDAILDMSDAELENAGLTRNQVRAIRSLTEQAAKAGYTLEEVLDNPDLLKGTNLLSDAFSNIGSAISSVFGAIKEAWHEIFGLTTTVSGATSPLWNIIAAFHKFTERLQTNEEALDKITRTFKGLFSIIDLVVQVIKTGLNFAFDGLRSIISRITGNFDGLNLGLGDMAANMGDALVNFHDWVIENDYITKAFEKVGSAIGFVVDKIGAFFNWFGNLPIVSAAVDRLREAFENLKTMKPEDIGTKIKNAFAKVKEFLEPVVDKIKELINFLRDKFPIFDQFCSKVEDFGAALKNFKLSDFGETVKSIFSNLGEIDFKSIGQDVIEGFKEGIGEGLLSLPQAVIEIGKAIIEAFKDALGVHSPSWITHDAGVDFVQGFIDGVSEMISNAGSKIAELVSAIIGGFKNIDVSSIKEQIDADKIFSATVSVVMLYLVKKFTKALNNMSSGIRGISSVLTGTGSVLRSFSKELKAMRFEKIAEGIKQLAIALAILVAAFVVLVYALSDKSMADIGKAILVIGGLAAILGLLALALSKLGSSSVSITKSGLQINTVIPQLIGIATSLLMLTAVLVIIGNMKTEKLQQGLKGMIALVVMMGGLIAAYMLLGKGSAAGSANIDKVGKMMLKISVAMLLMIVVIKQASKLSEEQVKKGAIAILAFTGLITALTLISKLGRMGNYDSLAKMMLKLSVALLVMVVVIKLLAKMEPAAIAKGEVAILGLVGIIALLALITNLGGESFDKLGVTLLAMSASMLLMVVVIKLLAKMDPAAIAKGEVAILGFVGIIAAMTAVTRIAKDTTKLAATILAMSAAIAVMTVAVIALSLLDTSALAKGLVAVGVLSAFISIMVAATGAADDAKANLIAITAAIAVMAASLAILSYIDGDKLMGAVAAMGVLMGMFTLMELAGQYATGALDNLIMMSVVVALLAAVLYELSQLPVDSVMGVAESLSLLILSVTAACALISYIPLEGAISGTAGLLIFIGAMTGVVAAFAAIAYKFEGFGDAMQKGGEVLAQVGYAIGNFVGSIIGGLGAGITSGLPAIGDNLSAFMENISGFIAGTSSIEDGMAAKVGSLTGAILLLCGAEIVAGLASLLSLGSSFADLGTQLSLFMVNATPFILGAKLMDEGSMNAVKSLAEALLIITKAELLDGIASFVSGGSSMDKFGEQLSAFGSAIVDFSTVVTGNINEEGVTAAANAGKIAASLYDSLPRSGGWMQTIFGEKDLSLFASQLEDFGEAIVGFSTTVDGNVSEEAVTAAVNAGELAAGLYDSIPKSGGWAQEIFGEQDLSTFSIQLRHFGYAIKKFSETVTDNVDEEAVTAATNAGLTIATLYDSLGKTGGLWQQMFGQEDLGTFGTQLTAFGDAIVLFSDTVKDKVDMAAVVSATAAGSIIAALANSLPDEETGLGKIKNFFTGTKSMTMDELGEAMVSFADAVSDMADSMPEDINVTVLTKFSTAATKISDTYSTLGGVDFSVSKDFKNSVKDLKTAFDNINKVDTSNVADFITAVTDVGAMTIDTSGLTASASGVSSAVDSLMGSVNTKLSGGKSDVTSSTETMMEGVPKGIKNTTTAAKDAIKTLITNMCTAITQKKSTVKQKFKGLGSDGVSGVRDNRSSMVSAGEYLGSGLTYGISLKYQAAYDAGYKLGQKAVQGEKDGQESKSPSKATIQAGKWLGEGLVIGIEQMGDAVYSASNEMGSTATGSISNAIAKISDAINSDIDAEPTIRPVIDLSDASDSANALASMFDLSPSIGVMSDISAISSSMQKNQNGSNSDVVSAIEKLSKKMGTSTGNTYNVNGVTYDDGSNISNAVQAIVRAARVERRT